MKINQSELKEYCKQYCKNKNCGICLEKKIAEGKIKKVEQLKLGKDKEKKQKERKNNEKN